MSTQIVSIKKFLLLEQHWSVLAGARLRVPAVLLFILSLPSCGGEPDFAPAPAHQSERAPDQLSPETASILAAHQETWCATDVSFPATDMLGQRSCAEASPADWSSASFPQAEPTQLRFSADKYGSANCPGRLITELNGSAAEIAGQFAWALPGDLKPADCGVAWSTSTVWGRRNGTWQLTGEYALAGAVRTVPSTVGTPCRLMPVAGTPALQDADIAEGSRSFTDVSLSNDGSNEQIRIVTTLVVGCETRPLAVFVNPEVSPFAVGDNGR